MGQFLVILRGAPASGKTTIAKLMRSFENKIVWLKVDNFKDFFSEDASLAEQKYVDECALATLEYLLDKGFSVVMEKIFFDPFAIPLAEKIARSRGIKTKVFQIRCSLSVLQKRDLSRPGVPQGLRKPLGNDIIKNIYEQLEKTYFPEAIELNTEKMSPKKCVEKIKQELFNIQVQESK